MQISLLNLSFLKQWESPVLMVKARLIYKQLSNSKYQNLLVKISSQQIIFKTKGILFRGVALKFKHKMLDWKIYNHGCISG